MNALIYCENGSLFIRRPNGLEWRHEQVDRPELGFEYEVLVYDDIEYKVEKWNAELPMEDQDRLPLSETDKDAIEAYIENCEPPQGINLNNQFISRISQVVLSNE